MYQGFHLENCCQLRNAFYELINFLQGHSLKKLLLLNLQTGLDLYTDACHQNLNYCCVCFSILYWFLYYCKITYFLFDFSIYCKTCFYYYFCQFETYGSETWIDWRPCLTFTQLVFYFQVILDVIRRFHKFQYVCAAWQEIDVQPQVEQMLFC